MKTLSLTGLAFILSIASVFAQDAGNRVQPHPSMQSEDHAQPAPADSEDVQQLQADLQRMKVLVNQMRTNLAFVQTSQTPLKHQFELEADAWQVIVEQMERRLKRMEERKSAR